MRAELHEHGRALAGERLDGLSEKDGVAEILEPVFGAALRTP
jgi:hypothetical protein